MIGIRRFVVALAGVLGVVAVEITAIICFSKVPGMAVPMIGISIAGAGALTGIVGSYVGTAAWAKRGEHATADLDP